MDYDKILTQLGEFGRWQQINLFLLWIPTIGAGLNVMIAAFAVMEPKNGYRCRNGCDDVNETLVYDTWIKDNYSMSEMFPSFNAKSGEYDKEDPNYCRYYKATLENGVCSFDNNTILSCHRSDDYAYEPFTMDSTVAIENNLVCGNYFWTIIIDEMYMLGVLLGSFIFGVMSDKIGRRHTMMVSVICCAGGNLLCCAMPNHWSYAIMRIVSSAGGEGIFIIAFTMALEFSGVKETVPGFPWVTWSTLLANSVGIPFALGEAIPALFAMGLKEWREFQATVSAVIAITAIVWFLLPETPRYLIANGKKEQAREMIEKAARMNKRKLTPDIFEAEVEEHSDDQKDEEIDLPIYGVKDMFRSSQIIITISLFICWPVVSLLYYGLTLSADKIHMTDNVYLSYILTSLIEIPAYILLPFVIDKWGRKPLFFLCQFVPGICCITAAFLTPGTAFFTVLVSAAKLGVSAAANIKYMYATQLFPTSIRGSAVGTCSMMARFGGMMSSIIGKYLPHIKVVPEEVPMILFGAFGIAGGLCALMLPETVGCPLPDTFEDIEVIKKKSKPMWKCYRPEE